MNPYKASLGSIKGTIGSPQSILKKPAIFRTRHIQLLNHQTYQQCNNMIAQETDSEQRYMLNKMLSVLIQNQNKNQNQLIKINRNIQTMVNLMDKKWGESKQNYSASQKLERQIKFKNREQQKAGVKKLFNESGCPTRSQINDYTNLFQSRYKNIDVQLPSGTDTNQLLTWIGQVCRRVFSVGFTLFKSGQLDQKKVKIFCSENIIRNLVKLSQNKKLSPSDFESIDKCLKYELLPYFCFKYPQTQEKKASSKFESILIERDTLNQNENDIRQKSGVDFHYQPDGNYNSQIMRFLNFIISLPARYPGLIQNNQTTTLGQSFRKDMKQIFESIEEQEVVLKMYQFNPKQKNKIKNLNINSTLNLSQKLQDEIALQQQSKRNQNYNRRQDSLKYRQKVQQYTTYHIGQKLNEVVPFTQYQIQAGELKLSNTALMRVATKWCSQLENCFNPNEILNRQTQWRMRDGSEKYMKKRQMVALNTLLQREKQIIDSEITKIKINNYENQVHFSQLPTIQELKKYTGDEAIVGQFATSIFQANENYLIKYLNLLIHGINKALRDFQKLQRVYFYENDLQKSSKIYNNFKQSDQVSNKSLLKTRLKYAVQYIAALTNLQSQIIQQTPQLISFRVGDLLRCKCTSKQTQIITLYKIVEYLSAQHPNFIKILKVRNKLDQGNKDILMNLMYKNSMIVEMQLAIKSEKSKFIEYSNKFNHYFYEMKRAQFGPIMEMCSIWASHDQRAEFYFESTKKNNKRKKNIQFKQCCLKQCINPSPSQLISIPFRCSSCCYFYFECNFYQKHSRCLNCGVVCSKCQTEKLEKDQNSKQLQKMIQKNQKIQKNQQIKIAKQLPLEGQIISINSKDKKIKTFKTLLYKGDYYMFYYFLNYRNQKELQLIQKFNKGKQKQQFQAFTLSHTLFQKSNKTEQIFNLTVEKAQKQYFIPKYLQQVNKSEKKSISFIGKDIKEDFFIQQMKQTVFQSVEKVNFSQNAIASLTNLDKFFPNVKLAVINNNIISRIDQVHIQHWKQTLSRIYLRENQISNLNGIGQLKCLCQLDLEGNQIDQFPNILLENLTILNLKNNKLKRLSAGFANMKELTNLGLSKNLLTDFPIPILSLTKLRVLHIKFNKIKIIPEQFGNLTELEELSASNNEVSTLPNSFGNLLKLKKLLIFSNRLSNLPESLEGLINLEQFNVSYNKLRKLPKNLGNLTKLSKLWIHENKLQQIPDSFANLNQLSRLVMQRNQLCDWQQQKILMIFDRIQRLKYVKLDAFAEQEGSLFLVSMKKICQNRKIKLIIS